MTGPREPGTAWRRLLAVACVLVLAAVGVAACGGDDKDSGSSGSSASSGGSSDATSTPAANAPKGEPIKTMTVTPVNWNGPQYPNIFEAAKAYEQWVNAHGGIKGRPLQVETCDEQGDPNQAATCARKAVADKVVAAVGSFAINGDRIVAVLERGNVAWFGLSTSISPTERNSPVSFEFGPSTAIGAGVAKQAAKYCKKPGYMYLDLPGASLGLDFTKKVLGEYGVTLAKSVAVPVASQDLAPQVAQVTSGTDCIILGLARTNVETALPALQQAGAKQRLFGSQGNLSVPLAKKFPELTNDAIIVGWYPDYSRPAWTDYREALKTYNAPSDLDYEGAGALSTWAGYVGFKNVVESMTGPINNETFLAAARKQTALSTGGATPPLDLSKSWTGGPEILKGQRNRSVSYATFKNGKPVAIQDFDDMTDLLAKYYPEG
jgi:ABC-type branched-subunit amino acid transport system substrate-binding protein